MPAAFAEERLNTEYRYGMAGGPEFNTTVVITASGKEYRNANWSSARGRWKMADDTYTAAELAALIAFFRARQGQAQGFRFRDWTDFKVVTAAGNGQGVATQISVLSKTWQLGKLYVSIGSTNLTRTITKPVSGTVKLFRDGVLLAAPGDYTLNTATGIVTTVADQSGHVLTWSGEFDVPVRFSTDTFQSEFLAYREADGEALYGVSGLDIIELTDQ